MRKCLGLGAVLWLALPAGWAVDWKSLKPLGYVSDFAGVVDPAGKARLEAYAADLQRATGAQIALVTIPSLQGEPVDDVAKAIARAWGVGQKGANHRILLLLAIRDRRSRLEIGSGLESLLPRSLAGSVMQQMRPALRARQYGEALMAAAETLATAVARAQHVRFTDSLPRRLRPTFANSVPWPAVAGLLLELAFLSFLGTYALRRAGGGRCAFRPAQAFAPGPSLVLPTGTQSGGGFGSFDSCDSFGGFGGGDFGGGGASSDW
ncbi:MAG TPA: TPM domain-containing protein [Bryobacteraceae bacterium]|nr:TPM domain-containing protein [Bryobacteraceae bacterium]